MPEPSSDPLDRLGDRSSDARHQNARDRAQLFQQHMLATAHQKSRGQEQVNFFPELFRLAAEAIETDVNEFCDRAETIFEEIEAFGQEPDLDTAWLYEITGEKDSFFFSTDSLVSELPPLPGKTRGRKPKPPDESTVIQAVQKAVQEAEAQDVLAIAHLENPADWILRISNALEENGGSSDFAQLKQVTHLSPGALFLGLLLGQERWLLSQNQFYGTLTVTASQLGSRA